MKTQELKELLTPEFLSTLHTAVECCDWCYNMAGQPKPQYDMGIMMEDGE
jgi:uncharacterized protein YeaC (DUF1315 family)